MYLCLFKIERNTFKVKYASLPALGFSDVFVKELGAWNDFIQEAGFHTSPLLW